MGAEKEVWHPIKHFESVRGLEVAVLEDEKSPGTVEVVILGTPDGFHTVAQIDKCDPGSVARALSLAEIVHSALEMVELSWFEETSTA